MTSVFLVSMVLRAGVDEAFVPFYFHDDAARRERLARTATAFVLLASSAMAGLAALLGSGMERGMNETYARLDELLAVG